MTPQFSSDLFDVDMLQACLQYVTDAFDWLTASGDNLFQALSQLDAALTESIAGRVRLLLANARSVQNAYAQINKLPPEILASIFSFLVTLPAGTSFSSLTGLDGVYLPIAGHICRYWRRIAHSTPALWTTIWLDRQRIVRCDEAKYFLSLVVSRSGALPLTISLDEPPPDIEPTLKAELLENMSRIEDLRLVDMNTDFLLSLGPDAPQLRMFLLTDTKANFHTGLNLPALFNGWQTPHLTAIGMSGCSFWHTATFGHLRHLAIASQHFDPRMARALLRVLHCNPALESLILSDFYCENGDVEELRQITQLWQPVEMRNLKRLFIRNSYHIESLAIVGMVNKTLDTNTPEGCAKYFSLCVPPEYTPADISDVFPPHALGAPTRLTAGQSILAGTDGQLAFGVTHVLGNHLDILLRDCVNVAEVQELRLYFVRATSERFLEALEHMQKVKKLVVAGDARHWLQHVHQLNLFPALDDLWVMAPSNNMGLPIIHFLKARKEDGRPIRTLRFVKHPSDMLFWPTFNSWKRHVYKFTPHVEHVVFDQSTDWTVMEMPPTCYTECPLEGCWDPKLWSSSFFLDTFPKQQPQ